MDDNKKEDRKLQIRIAQLNANHQFYIASLFGLLAVSITAWTFGSQLILANYPKINISILFAISVYLVAVLASIGSFEAGFKLKKCRADLRKLE